MRFSDLFQCHGHSVLLDVYTDTAFYMPIPSTRYGGRISTPQLAGALPVRTPAHPIPIGQPMHLTALISRRKPSNTIWITNL